MYYDSAMENARRRFESDLRSKQAENEKHKNEHFTQLEETNKFMELKKLKDKQKIQLQRSMLEDQIESKK